MTADCSITLGSGRNDGVVKHSLFIVFLEKHLWLLLPYV